MPNIVYKILATHIKIRLAVETNSIIHALDYNKPTLAIFIDCKQACDRIKNPAIYSIKISKYFSKINQDDEGHTANNRE